MNWGYFFAWVAAILASFFFTGWPVSPHLTSVWGNHYEAKNLTYFSVLYLHYLLGALFFSFLALGLLRNVIWKSGGNKQLISLLAWSVFVASIFSVALVHQYAPDDQVEVDINTSDQNVTSDNEGNKTDV